MARKTKYSKELIDAICKSIEEGASNKDAAELAGIGETTFYEWLSSNYNNPLTEDEKAEFRESMCVAGAKRRNKLASIIIKASEANWRAAAWYLERTSPEEYGKAYKVSTSYVEPELEHEIDPRLSEAYDVALRMVLTRRVPDEYKAKPYLFLEDSCPIEENIKTRF